MSKEQKDLLVIYPLHDIPTATSYHAALHLVKWARDEGFDVRSLGGPGAIRPLLWRELQIANYRLISYLGHGAEDRLFGMFPPGDLLMFDNVNWVKDHVISTMACLSGKRLAPFAFQSAGVVYFGSDTLMFGAFNEFEYNYLDAWIDCETILAKRLLMGDTFGTALEIRKNTYSRYIDLFTKNMKEWFAADWYIQSFVSNRDNYYLFGPPDGRLPESMEEQIMSQDVVKEAVKPIVDIGRVLVGSFVIGATLVATTLAPIAVDLATKELEKRGYLKKK